MTSKKIYSFEEALLVTEENKKKCTNGVRLLLGNGFSRSYFGDNFSYTTLFEAIKDEKDNNRIKKVFEYLGTSNFEAVLTALKNTQFICSVYGIKSTNINTDYQKIQSALADAIVKVHPPQTNVISEEAKLSCLNFLNKFTDDIFSVNYDILLYWVLVQNNEFSDYFFRDEDTPQEYCEYFRDGSKRGKHVHFLHGALHLFQKGGRTIKKVWGNTIPLVSQIKDEMQNGNYPLVVAEGDSKSKLSQIKSIPYLEHAFSKLENSKGQLFTFGFSFSEQDLHIVRTIEKNLGIRFLWIGIRGDFNKPSNQKIFKIAKKMEENRLLSIADKSFNKNSKNGDLQVYFFNAGVMNIWGNNL